MSNNLRVRGAPSPSGTLHCGNAKSFLFNWLFSKKYNAEFLLRIEDTDQARVVDGGAEKILEDLKWLGLTPTMGYGTNNKPAGVYTQMERLPIYKKYAEELIANGKAYLCYCTEEELNKQREEAIAKNPKNPWKYPGTCRNITKQLNKNYVVRFKAPTEGAIEFDDIVFGKRSIPNKENFDFVIFRQNGIPLFNFANAVDDGIIDYITHIIRGADHLKNLPAQLMLYEALGIDRAKYCHLPMLLNSNGGKLSKRDGAVSVAEFRQLGFSPNAILNYLVRFGWGWKSQEVFSIDEMIEKFSLEAVGRNDGKYDFKKFSVINYEHLKSSTLTPDDMYAKHLHPFIAELGIDVSHEHLASLTNLVRTRSKNFREAAHELTPVLQQNISIDQSAIEKILTPEAKTKLSAFNAFLQSVNDWTETNLRAATNDWLTKQNLTIKDIGQPCRISLTGRTQSPELFQVMGVLGKETVLNRIKAQL
jgi:glutamyl-tRNA synthetase